jgi:hypothetical protein
MGNEIASSYCSQVLREGGTLEIAIDSHDGCLVIASHVSGEANGGNSWDLIGTALAFHLAIDFNNLFDSSGAHRMTESK